MCGKAAVLIRAASEEAPAGCPQPTLPPPRLPQCGLCRGPGILEHSELLLSLWDKVLEPIHLHTANLHYLGTKRKRLCVPRLPRSGTTTLNLLLACAGTARPSLGATAASEHCSKFRALGRRYTAGSERRHLAAMSSLSPLGVAIGSPLQIPCLGPMLPTHPSSRGLQLRTIRNQAQPQGVAV